MPGGGGVLGKRTLSHVSDIIATCATPQQSCDLCEPLIFHFVASLSCHDWNSIKLEQQSEQRQHAESFQNQKYLCAGLLEGTEGAFKHQNTVFVKSEGD